MTEEVNKDINSENEVNKKTEQQPEDQLVADSKSNNKSEKEVLVDDEKFMEKASNQVNRLFKDLETLAFHGSKSELSDEAVEQIIAEIREQSNIAKKQFSSNMEEKEFGAATSHVNKVLKELKNLGELSNKHSGEYTEEHSEKIFESLRKKINETKKGLKVKDKKDNTFSF